ncbi:DNA-binding response regulator, OmpR family, contains REC and winged-helix (wHTH) domain [Paenibacillus sp. 1_12]|uniref:response regulator transcription factor n=1 Tax=Paenibacillus sp. 1_12 TaxID=1566278 RepID=UPI0008F36284|nr:response regulator transcription factor [Paenibacillus sp. 1_12]SFL15168.1 DNA-binding response regulator, OmpR family, contains REC and winged-helix (wHTH) domain [Paenibacillus sp. 1_12]
MAEQTILVIEDDPEIRNIIQLYLQRNQYEVALAEHGDEGIAMLEAVQPDLIILDVLLPGRNGFEVCKEIRKVSSVPVLFLSCMMEEHDKIVGLGVGGDDYMTKPFSPNELVARVEAHLRRPFLLGSPSNRVEKIQYKGLYMDLLNRHVSVNGTAVNLVKKEFELLRYLGSRPGKIFTHEELFREIWGQKSYNDTRTLIVHISNLRKKIEPDPANPEFIINVHGVGYKFNAS